MAEISVSYVSLKCIYYIVGSLSGQDEVNLVFWLVRGMTFHVAFALVGFPALAPQENLAFSWPYSWIDFASVHKNAKKKPIKTKKQANMQPISKPNKLGLYWGYVIYIFQVCTNGLISVGKRYYRRNPKRLTSLRKDVIAAFWANTDVTSASSVSYQIVDEGSSEFREVCLVSGITWGFYDFY